MPNKGKKIKVFQYRSYEHYKTYWPRTCYQKKKKIACTSDRARSFILATTMFLKCTPFLSISGCPHSKKKCDKQIALWIIQQCTNNISTIANRVCTKRTTVHSYTIYNWKWWAVRALQELDALHTACDTSVYLQVDRTKTRHHTHHMHTHTQSGKGCSQHRSLPNSRTLPRYKSNNTTRT